MDPALQELLDAGEATDEVTVVLRLRDAVETPRGLRIVARLGPIATARLERAAIWQVYGNPAIVSVKAPRWLVSEYGPVLDEADAENVDIADTDQRRPDDVKETGKGSIVALVDWGCDFAHPDFVEEGGFSRILALWDQRTTETDGNPYGYGRVLRRGDLTAALKADDPYAVARYHPGRSDTGIGAHGTHVMSIAAGNGRGGGPLGIAPAADLLFVHLGAPGWEKAGALGDSSNLVEALHFILAEAGDRPLVINMSIGRHAGPHDGSTLVEQAIDWLLRARPGTCMVQSAGNYFARNVHSSGQLRNGEVDELPFVVNPGDTTPNELEVWYPGSDIFEAGLIGPDGKTLAELAQNSKAPIIVDGARVGTLYHRASDPNNRDHHINLFQYPNAPPGTWRLVLTGRDVSDGRYHAWLERDPGCSVCQALFTPAHADRNETTGSICNGLQTIAVGAYDGHDPDHGLAPFSSSGPTRDGRVRPVLLAPGVRVLAARSQPLRGTAGLLTRMSGTSMAAPHVTGTVALMFEAGGRLDIVDTRRALLEALSPVTADDPKDGHRIGFGKLDIAGAVRRAAEIAAAPAGPALRQRPGSASSGATEAQSIPAMRAAEAGDETPAAAKPGEADVPMESGEVEASLVAATLPESEEEIAMCSACCGDACKTCEHCKDNACDTCPHCHAQTASKESAGAAIATAPVMEAAGEPLIQVVPSPLAREDADAWSDADEPAIQVVPSPLAGRGTHEAPEEESWAAPPAWQAEVDGEGLAVEADGEGLLAEAAVLEGAEAAEAAYPHPIDAAEAILEAGVDDSTEFLAQSLAAIGRQWPPGATVRSLYDDLTGRSTPARRVQMDRHFAVIGRPGRTLGLALQAGDIVIRRGDGRFAHAALIAHPVLYSEPEARAHGMLLEGPWPGLYAHIVEPGAHPRRGRTRFARRLGRPDGSVLPDTLVIRHRGEADLGEASAEAEPDPNIRWLQSALNRLIGAGLVVDGLIGPATRDGVRRYQAARGLQVDGIVGPQTLSSLRSEYYGGSYGPPAYTPPPTYTPPQGYPPPPSYTPPSYRPPPPTYTPPQSYPPPSYTPPQGYRPPPPAYTPPQGYAPPPTYTPPQGYRPPPPTYTPPEGYRPPPPTYTPPYGYRPPPPTYTPPQGYKPPPGYTPPRPPDYKPPEPYVPPSYKPPEPTPTPSGYDEAYGTCRTLDRFGYDNAGLTYDHRAVIGDVAQRIVASASTAVTVTGYASPEGTESYNLQLGQRRADAVATALREALDRVRAGSSGRVAIATRSEGEGRQISPDGPANRRVEICYAEPAQPRPPTPGPRPPQPGPGPQPQSLVRYSIESPQGQAMLARYAEAVRRMNALPGGDPTSWTFQWYIHWTRSDTTKERAISELFRSGPPAARALANQVWNTCRAHFGFGPRDELFFLPWHRMYLYYFERICRRVLNDPSFTVPYWNYTSGSTALPAPFIDPRSPLFRSDRNPGPNRGRPIDQAEQEGTLSAGRVLAIPNYARPSDDEPGFNESLDRSPHGDVHTLTGTRERGMGSINWAAGDPIFWVHHANIDRIWASWNNAGRRNPSSASWLDARFTFADENGQAVTAAVRNFVGTGALGYSYDSLERVPAPSVAELAEAAEPDRHRREAMAKRSVVAPRGGIPLSGNAIKVNLGPLAREAGESDEADGRPKRMFLVLRNYKANVQPGVLYHIYLALPPGTGGAAAGRHYVGAINFFDAVPHPGHTGTFTGRTARFEVTDIADRLREGGHLVTPSVTIAPSGQPASAAQPVIGEISLVEK